MRQDVGIWTCDAETVAWCATIELQLYCEDKSVVEFYDCMEYLHVNMQQ